MILINLSMKSYKKLLSLIGTCVMDKGYCTYVFN